MVEGRGHNGEHWLRDIDKILTNLSLHDQTDKQGMGRPGVEGSLPLQGESIRLKGRSNYGQALVSSQIPLTSGRP